VRRDSNPRQIAYKKPSWKEGTIIYAEAVVNPKIKKSNISSPYKALELREWLLANTTEGMAKRILIQLL
jgi:hypothetical protein